ncbi:MAG: acyltransferase [Nitrospirae bacterium]|nr:acyltransferase [Candidatus Manganitrophaceae bacterium]
MDLREITGAWDHASLPANVRVGEGCYLERKESFARFRSICEPGLTIGDRVKVYTWTTFNVEPSGRVEVGDDSILVGAVLMCAERIRIGKRVILSYHVTIADCDFHPLDPDLRKEDAIRNAPGGDPNQRPPLVTSPVVVEDDVWVGIGAIILKGVRLGRGARVGAGAVVTSDVPPGASVAGNPAKWVRPEVRADE